MANEEHLTILRQGVDIWNAWREQNSDVLPELIEADLSGTDLSGINLREADLWMANLSEVDLSGAILRMANLSSANLKKANLEEADLWRANLKEANLGSSKLVRVNFRAADLSGADLFMADLEESNLWNADLKEANLKKANLRGAIIRSTNLKGTDLDGAEFTNAEFNSKTTWPTDFNPEAAGAIKDKPSNIPITSPSPISQIPAWGWVAVGLGLVILTLVFLGIGKFQTTTPQVKPMLSPLNEVANIPDTPQIPTTTSAPETTPTMAVSPTPALEYFENLTDRISIVTEAKLGQVKLEFPTSVSPDSIIWIDLSISRPVDLLGINLLNLLVVDTSTDTDYSLNPIDGENLLKKSNILIDEMMKVELIAPSLDVVERSPAIQSIDTTPGGEETHWNWYVIAPQNEGVYALSFRVFIDEESNTPSWFFAYPLEVVEPTLIP